MMYSEDPMNNVMKCQAATINEYYCHHKSLELAEFMSDINMPFDQQDRVLNAIQRLSKPSARKISIILELAGNNSVTEMLLK